MRNVPCDRRRSTRDLAHGPNSTQHAEMRPAAELGPDAAPFVAKLWIMLQKPEYNDWISWSPNGDSLIVKNQEVFTKKLSNYFKHRKMPSFVRQLNMYGFHKKVSPEMGGLKCDKDEMEFANPYFRRDQPHLAQNIKRKVPAKKNQVTNSVTYPIRTEMDQILDEVRTLKGRQDTLDNALKEMKIENVTLWKELVDMRQKHLKQQNIINKLIQFLADVVQPSRSVKRPYPLMINDSSHSQKRCKLLKQENPGPVIHELDASEAVDSDVDCYDLLETESPTVQSPAEHIGILTDNATTENTICVFKDEPPKMNISTAGMRRFCKGKKKRKNNMPVKILIPSLENGKKTREQLDTLISANKDEPMTLLKNEFIDSKPVPSATVRSSKLAAMAANIKSQDINTDMDSVDTEIENMKVVHDDGSIMNLQELIGGSKTTDDSNSQNNVENIEDDSSLKTNKMLNQMDNGRSVLMRSYNEPYKNGTIKSQKENNNYDVASTSSSQDLSVSRISPSDAKYRLGSTEQIKKQVESTQHSLTSYLRDTLSNLNNSDSNYDPNSIGFLLEYLGADNNILGDDLLNLPLPITPELDPNFDSIKADDTNSANESARGQQLMTFNPNNLYYNQSIPDLIFENPSETSDIETNNVGMNYMDIEDDTIPTNAILPNNMNSKS
ncbi:PREDICTED: heat shock factor protein 1-like isoform X2 [Wasmannia auropunctata]|uniref:heat shock factor protein 1-like isoform X2 n=1 Tax=Wasmannia auropunctata TaxID=64793 RepID=UPI0005F0B910|nr:PREDICTED: heat shock factor protein 1-like isoform X2 [Wasmannia auropunctata]